MKETPPFPLLPSSPTPHSPLPTPHSRVFLESAISTPENGKYKEPMVYNFSGFEPYRWSVGKLRPRRNHERWLVSLLTSQSKERKPENWML
ncbi:MAG: hypothetical protein DSM106950_24015 [Stigonema ocellatum SAG 48.90 = DSM 106950]|nr:hypothetical protein [Stigonema ocellatum SAG 48.90 = DSM 106950]